MKVLIYIFVIFISVIPAKSQWKLAPESRITIHGTTNVNHFQCQTNLREKRGNWAFVRTGIKNENPTITIPVDNFDCGNQVMNKDFRKALHEEQYPNIKVYLISIAAIPLGYEEEKKVIGDVKINLAGEPQEYKVNFNILSNNKNTIALKGSKPICFSDFNLEPPKKFMGLVCVQDELTVDLKLIFKK